MNASAGRRIPRSTSLTVRMVLVALLTPLTALGLLAAVVILLPSRFLIGVAIALGLGLIVRLAADGKGRQPPGRVLSENEDPELYGLVERLCVLADIQRPELVVTQQWQPNSWVVHLPRQTPRLYLTAGLRRLLTLDELQAVLAHELAHIVNRDALVMSVAGMPGSVMRHARGGGLDGLLVMSIGEISQIGTAILSRYRELAADAGSAAITGRPSALASALIKVSESLELIPTEDLRAAAALNSFNLVAVSSRHRRWREIRLIARIAGVAATHPPLKARLAALSALERDHQRQRS